MVVIEVMVNRILNNISRHSLLLMSDYGLLLELGSLHCQSDMSFLESCPLDETQSEFLQ